MGLSEAGKLKSYITYFALWQKYKFYISSIGLKTACWRAFRNILERNGEKRDNKYLEFKCVIWVSK